MPRTFAIGDIHGDLDALRALVDKLPSITKDDTLVFMGDYVDRGPRSRDVVRVVRRLDEELGCNVVCLRGNHEDAWLRVIDRGWPEFVLPVGNGCYAAVRSYLGRPIAAEGDLIGEDELRLLFSGGFFPEDDVAWMRGLPYFYEDEHAIYVHAGLVEDDDGRWLHPRDVEQPHKMLWTRTERFFREYKGKLVVIGHTATDLLPPELSTHTPENPGDVWVSEHIVAIDTGAGKGGFLTCVELPSLTIYESR